MAGGREKQQQRKEERKRIIRLQDGITKKKKGEKSRHRPSGRKVTKREKAWRGNESKEIAIIRGRRVEGRN